MKSFKRKFIFGVLSFLVFMFFQHSLTAFQNQNSKTALLRKARSLFHDGDFFKASEAFEYLIKQYPADIDSWAGLCWSLYHLGREQEASETFQEILKITLLTRKLLDQYLYFTQLTGRQEEALRYLEDTKDMAKDKFWLNQKLFYLYLKTSRLKEARELLELLKEGLNLQDKLSLEMALCYQLIKEANYTDSLAILKEIRQEYPHYWNAMDLEILNYVYLKDYQKALETLISLRKYRPAHLDLKRRQAEIFFEMKKYKEAAVLFREVFEGIQAEPVTVLLYHGIVDVEDGANVTAGEFKEHIKGLAQAGYHFITFGDFLNFFQGSALESPSVLITFDDARRDSYQNTTAILEKYHVKAVMFTPAYETLLDSDPFFLSLKDLQLMLSSPWWDIQAHGYMAGKESVSDETGNHFHFLTAKKWSTQKNRLEEDQEYYDRIEDDHTQFRNLFMERIPGLRTQAFAFPFGDFGQDAPSYADKAIEYNLEIAKKFYAMAFYQDDKGINYSSEDPYLARRYRVPPSTTAEGLLKRLNQNKINFKKTAQQLLTSLIKAKDLKAALDFARPLVEKGIMEKDFLDDVIFAYLNDGRRDELLIWIDYLLGIPVVSANASYLQVRLKAEEGAPLDSVEYAQLESVAELFSARKQEDLKKNFFRERFLYFHDEDRIGNYTVLSDVEFSLKEGINFLLGHEFTVYTRDDFDPESEAQNAYKTGIHLLKGEYDFGLNYLYRDNRDSSNTHGVASQFSVQFPNAWRFVHDFQYDRVPTLNALVHEVKVHGQRLQWEIGSREETGYRLLAGFRGYSDDNERWDVGFLTQKRLTESQPLYGSLRYDYADTQKESENYYSPQRLSQMRLGLSWEKGRKQSSVVLKYNFGYGVEETKQGFIQSTGADFNYTVSGDWKLFFSPQYLQTPSYSSVEITCGTKYAF